MPLCKRANLEIHLIYDIKKYNDRFDARQKSFKVCEFWDVNTGNCSKDNKKCIKGKPVAE